MGGLYSHTVRSDGDVIDEDVYNDDHQNHIDNHDPDHIDDWSVTVSQMRSATNPGEVASESQATSLGGELARLRFAILELKQRFDSGVSYWYESGQALRKLRMAITGTLSIPNTTLTKIAFGTKSTSDPESEMDVTTNYRITPSAAGDYLVTAAQEYDAMADGKIQFIHIYKNGASIVRTANHSGSVNDVGVSVSRVVDCNGTTDFIEAWTYHNHGSNRDLQSNAGTFLEVRRLPD